MDYFAYGSNLLESQMADRCPGASHGHRAVLDGYRFLINERGVATIVEDPNSVVHGVLWHCGPGDIVALDGYEGLTKGLYRRTSVEVTPEGHDKTSAVVYIDDRTEPGAPREGYLEKVLAGASAFELPEQYQSFLASLGCA